MTVRPHSAGQARLLFFTGDWFPLCWVNECMHGVGPILLFWRMYLGSSWILFMYFYFGNPFESCFVNWVLWSLFFSSLVILGSYYLTHCSSLRSVHYLWFCWAFFLLCVCATSLICFISSFFSCCRPVVAVLGIWWWHPPVMSCCVPGSGFSSLRVSLPRVPGDLSLFHFWWIPPLH